jgi:hypothetical protein
MKASNLCIVLGLLNPEKEDNRILRNASNYSPKRKTSYHGKFEFSARLQGEFQISIIIYTFFTSYLKILLPILKVLWNRLNTFVSQ